MLMGHDSFVFHRVQSGDVCVFGKQVLLLLSVCAMKSTKAPDKTQAEGIKTSQGSFMEA